jgi:hypothetical protein
MPIRLTLAALLLPALLITPVLAKSHGQILSNGGPYSAAAKPGADIPALCKDIVAKQQSSKQAMADAAQLYFHGTLMGQKCVPVDYVKAITLMKASGHTGEYNGLVHALKQRAASGNALAVAAVAKLKL